jgi:RimJ/RimL family protein N-acetyltransferase
MKLKPLVDTCEIELVAAWMAEKENYQWLDFGNGNQILTAASLKVMTQRDIHFLRIFTPDSNEEPIGLVALSNVNRRFKTATLWYILGNKSYGGRGYTSRAVSNVLTLAFNELELQAVNAWAVEQNLPSIRILERNNFQLIGRQRKCHYIDDRPCDRLLFDLLASGHKKV